ncbi:MAG TPA: hypothetical protein VGR28_10375 [Candidatus Thermoplasmatota archaeon]|nr:hypothetical protein [Candidatus Thermoplasmatota archaeon]
MHRPVVAVEGDRLVVQLHGLAALAAARRRIAVPLRAIVRAGAGAPAWPPILPRWRVGTHLPPRGLAIGSFRHGGRRRFLFLTHSTRRVLRVELEGARWDEVELDVADPDDAVRRILHIEAA